jgi:hypothetical protein
MMNEFEFHKNGSIKRHERMIYDPRVMYKSEFPKNLDSSDWLQYSYYEETYYWENGNPKSYAFYFKNKKVYEAKYNPYWIISSSRGSAFFAINWTDTIAIGDTFQMLFLSIQPPAVKSSLSIVKSDTKEPVNTAFSRLSKNWGFAEFIVSKEGSYTEQLSLELKNSNTTADTLLSGIFKYAVLPEKNK